ncbi:MAG: biotin-dependent carboxyltransferase family protein [Thermoanaerobaculia bacterium]
MSTLSPSSSTPTIRVIRPGAMTLVVDLGRPGHGASGVPRGGAFDPWAARAANRRVGNAEGEALLEITLAGPELELQGVAAIARVGDPFPIELESASHREICPPLRSWASALAPRETTRIAIGRAASGVRTWLAVAGGIDVPVVLGSRTTELAGGFGGHEGRSLRAGDRVSCFPSGARAFSPSRSEAAAALRPPIVLRVLPGPDARLVSGERPGPEALEGMELRVEPRSDRRGIRLHGSALALSPHAPLRSQGTLPGTVQIPPAGQPIVLGVDAPVTGGYPWIAQVIEADLELLAHLAPGDSVRFATVGYEVAERALAERRARFEAELARE